MKGKRNNNSDDKKVGGNSSYINKQFSLPQITSRARRKPMPLLDETGKEMRMRLFLRGEDWLSPCRNRFLADVAMFW